MKQTTPTPIHLDLSGINLEEIDVFLQESGRAIPELAASSSCGCHSNKSLGSCSASCTKRPIHLAQE
jgi:hypothetical protein